MVYEAAIIGCHGIGKTTLAKKLESCGYKVFDEAPINEYVGKNAFLAELHILLDNMKINTAIKSEAKNCISDRCTFIDVLIYSESFYKMGWLSLDQLKTIYSLVNHSSHDWTYPKQLVCLKAEPARVLENIKKRNRSSRLKEEDSKYITTILETYEEFYNGKLKLDGLNPELAEKINSIPKTVLDSFEDAEKVALILK